MGLNTDSGWVDQGLFNFFYISMSILQSLISEARIPALKSLGLSNDQPNLRLF